MPVIILKKDFTRGEKVFKEGSAYFTSWSGYRDFLANEYCDDIEGKPKKKLKRQKLMNEEGEEIKFKEDGN